GDESPSIHGVDENPLLLIRPVDPVNRRRLISIAIITSSSSFAGLPSAPLAWHALPRASPSAFGSASWVRSTVLTWKPFTTIQRFGPAVTATAPRKCRDQRESKRAPR